MLIVVVEVFFAYTLLVVLAAVGARFVLAASVANVVAGVWRPHPRYVLSIFSVGWPEKIQQDLVRSEACENRRTAAGVPASAIASRAWSLRRLRHCSVLLDLRSAVRISVCSASRGPAETTSGSAARASLEEC